MGKPREALLGAAIGAKGCGKSEQTLLQALRYVRRGQNFLICDVNEEYAAFQLKSLPEQPVIKIKPLLLSDINIFCRQQVPEIRRIRFVHDNGKRMTLDEIADAIFFILDNFRDGGILIEDISKVISDFYPADLIGAICTQRHVSTDIILHFQFLGKLTNPKIWGNLNYVRMHRTMDTVERFRPKLTDHYEIMKVAECLIKNAVDNSNNKRFFCYVDLDTSKIKGAFSKDMYIAAVQKYINGNYTKIMKPLFEERDEDGNKVYDNKTAYRQLKQKLFDLYYGNSD